MPLPPKVKDITGQEFGYWTVIRMDKLVKGHGAYWECECRCGHRASVKSNDLRSGNTKSCGCAKAELVGEAHTKHGQARTNLSEMTGAYRSYRSMLQRCSTPTNTSYDRYGARGIGVCDRWLESFEAFYEDMGDRPEGYSLERKDYNADYTPENCCWIPNEEQQLNTRASRHVALGDEVMVQADAARRLGVTKQKISEWRKNPHRVPAGIDIRFMEASS